MTGQIENTQWIAIEASQSQLMAWLVGPNGNILNQSKANLHFENAPLQQALSMIENWLVDHVTTDVFSCGLRQHGLSTLPNVPYSSDNSERLFLIDCEDERVRMHEVLGVRQAEPADFMTYETTMIAGYLTENPKFDGVICIPAQNSKWVRVSAEEIVSFESYMSEELLGALIGFAKWNDIEDLGWDWDAFDSALEDVISKPEKLAGRLMQVRQNGFLSFSNLEDRSVSHNSLSRFAGLLLGAEIASSRPYWLGQEVIVLGQGKLDKCYVKALQAQGAMVSIAPLATPSLLGLAAARNAQ